MKQIIRISILFLLVTGCNSTDKQVIQGTNKTTYNRRDQYVGSTLSKRYHDTFCDYAMNIPEECLVTFQDEKIARQHGYVPCRLCNQRDSTETLAPDTSVYIPPKNLYPIQWRTKIKEIEADYE